MHSSNLQQISCVSFVLIFLSANAAPNSAVASLPVCGKILVARMFDVCQSTDCDALASPMTADTYAPFDLLTECCLQGCETARIEQYCCYMPPSGWNDRGSPFQPRVPSQPKRTKGYPKKQHRYNYQLDLGY